MSSDAIRSVSFIPMQCIDVVYCTLGDWKTGQFRVSLCLCFKASLVENYFYGNDFDLHKNETVC